MLWRPPCTLRDSNLPAGAGPDDCGRSHGRDQCLDWGAESVPGKEGAFTGEISGSMIKSAGCTHVLVGHSERRRYFHETDANVFEKTVAALEAGLTPVVCVGEVLEERQGGKTEEVLTRQFRGGLGELTADQFARLVVAYEPIWPSGREDGDSKDRSRCARDDSQGNGDGFGEAAAKSLRILYGSSVKPGNVGKLMAQEEINGVLVGGRV